MNEVEIVLKFYDDNIEMECEFKETIIIRRKSKGR